MNLRKRVIESTIIAVMLTVVTAVTAVMQTASVENVPEPQQETKAVADVQADGSAGIIDRKSTRLNSSHSRKSRMPSSA